MQVPSLLISVCVCVLDLRKGFKLLDTSFEAISVGKLLLDGFRNSAKNFQGFGQGHRASGTASCTAFGPTTSSLSEPHIECHIEYELPVPQTRDAPSSGDLSEARELALRSRKAGVPGFELAAFGFESRLEICLWLGHQVELLKTGASGFESARLGNRARVPDARCCKHTSDMPTISMAIRVEVSELRRLTRFPTHHPAAQSDRLSRHMITR